MTTEAFFNTANTCFDDALPFALYRKPNANTLKGFFQEDDDIYYSENLMESGFVFAPFDNTEKTVLIPKSSALVLESNADFEYRSETPNETALPLETAEAFHIQLVTKAINEIENKTFKKVVVSRKETVILKENNPFELFKRLLATYKNAFVYCWYHPKVGLWLGATPETLLSVTGNRFTTMSLAGTQTFVNKKDVVWQAKETEEQALVTTYISDNLTPLVSSLSVGQVETLKAGSLLHLRTKISGLLTSNLKDVVTALHPTPAVCGLPKLETKAFIIANENYKRDFYTGYLGELNITESKTRNSNRRNVENNAYGIIKKVTNLYVNLRCMQLTETKASIYVGGGITKDSSPEKEWQETVNKTQTMKKVLF